MANFLKNNILLLSTLLYGVPLLLYVIVIFSTNIAIENNNLDNGLTLGFFLVPILIIYWLTFIKISWLRYFLLITYSLFLLFFYAVSSLAIIFTASDVLKMNNNGFRAIYEITIDHNRKIIVYRTPDSGAFGGDNIDVALVKRIGLGLISREFSDELHFKDKYVNTGGQIIYKGNEYHIPPLDEIYSIGDLR